VTPSTMRQSTLVVTAFTISRHFLPRMPLQSAHQLCTHTTSYASDDNLQLSDSLLHCHTYFVLILMPSIFPNLSEHSACAHADTRVHTHDQYPQPHGRTCPAKHLQSWSHRRSTRSVSIPLTLAIDESEARCIFCTTTLPPHRYSSSSLPRTASVSNAFR
jgi:hypothetical protein